MEEPKEAKPRPSLGNRSHTAGPAFDSPPKRVNTADSGTETSKEQKKHHHLPSFFHTSSHDHDAKHRSKKNDESDSSKLHIRQHLQAVNPVEGLATMVSNVSGGGDKHGSSHSSNGRESQDREREVQPPQLRERVVKPEDVEKERERGRLRDLELRSSLDSLSELATSTTRRLDYAFYNVLEKAGQLHSIITSLQELSDSSRELHERFQTEANGVDEEISKQIGAFKDFSNQQHEVEGLVARISSAKHASERLSSRLEAARKRVELWEEREKEWQKKTSRRLTLSWTLAGILAALIIGFLVWRHLLPSTLKSVKQLSSIDNSTLPDFIAKDMASFHSTTIQVTSTAGRQNLPTDLRLRRLDEL